MQPQLVVSVVFGHRMCRAGDATADPTADMPLTEAAAAEPKLAPLLRRKTVYGCMSSLRGCTLLEIL